MEENLIKLTLQEAKLIRDVITAGIQRSTYQPKEISTVGRLFDRLDQAIEAIEPTPAPQPTGDQSDETVPA